MTPLGLLVNHGSFTHLPDTELINSKPILAIWFNAEPIFLLLKQDPEVAHLAAVYLKYASLGLPAYSFLGISRCAFIAASLSCIYL